RPRIDRDDAAASVWLDSQSKLAIRVSLGGPLVLRDLPGGSPYTSTPKSLPFFAKRSQRQVVVRWSREAGELNRCGLATAVRSFTAAGIDCCRSRYGRNRVSSPIHRDCCSRGPMYPRRQKPGGRTTMWLRTVALSGA